MTLSLRKVEFAWHVGALLLLMGAFVPIWRGAAAADVDATAGDPVLQVLEVGAYLCLGLLLLNPRKAVAAGLRNPLLWVLVGWACISVLWSGAPEVTFRRAASVLLGTFYALLLFVRYPFRRVLAMLGTALAIALVAGLVAVFLVPDWAVMGRPHPGAWRGVFNHKNTLGRTSLLGLVVFGLLYSDSRGYKRWTWGCLGLAALITLVLSRSATAWVTALVVVTMALIIRLARGMPAMPRVALASLGVGIALTALALLPSYLSPLLGLLGKNLALTGRVPLWEKLVPLAMQRPLLGYGFGAFWLGWGGPSAQVWAISTWDAGHAHNGYLDLWLELGLVGVTMVLVLMAVSLMRGVRANLANSALGTEWFAFVVTMIIAVLNLVQAMLFQPGLGGIFFWILFVYAYLLTAAPRAHSHAVPNGAA